MGDVSSNVNQVAAAATKESRGTGTSSKACSRIEYSRALNRLNVPDEEGYRRTGEAREELGRGSARKDTRSA